MNLRTLIVASTLLLSPLDSLNTYSLNTNNKLYETENTKEELLIILSENIWEEIWNIQNDNQNIIIKNSIKNIQKWPLCMKWTKQSLWELLWYKQSDFIINSYNKWDSLSSTQSLPINKFDTISYPMIIDELKEVFPINMEDLDINSSEKYKDLLSKRDSIILISKIWKNKHALAYYLNRKLFMATNISIWLNKQIWDDNLRTPSWNFSINQKLYRWTSIEYNNAPMPYALWFQKWKFYLHQWKVSWSPLSHGCIRVPGVYQQILFYSTNIWTPIIVEDELY